MMKSISLLVVSSLLLFGFNSCSTHSRDTVQECTQNAIKIGPFKQGNFIPDEKPLEVRNSKDLREVALSLPIWEGPWKESEKWVYQYSKNGLHVDQWTNPADGAQHAVTIKRLEKSPDGLMRIEVHHPVLLVFTPSGGQYYPWVAVLERRKGGWFVESAKNKVD